MLKGIERVTPLLKFELRGVDIQLHAIRQDVPPRLEAILALLTFASMLRCPGATRARVSG